MTAMLSLVGMLCTNIELAISWSLPGYGVSINTHDTFDEYRCGWKCRNRFEGATTPLVKTMIYPSNDQLARKIEMNLKLGFYFFLNFISTFRYFSY